MQTIGAQDRSIQDLGLRVELGLGNALRPAAVETDEQHLGKYIIDLTGNTDRERMRACINKSGPGTVQEGNDVVPPQQENRDNGPSLFDYNPYNDYDNKFDPYLEYGEGYGNRTAFEDAFYR